MSWNIFFPTTLHNESQNGPVEEDDNDEDEEAYEQNYKEENI